MATQSIPFSAFPSSQGSDGSEKYLTSVGLSRFDAFSTFKSEATMLAELGITLPQDPAARETLFQGATKICQRAITCESLGLQPLDIAAITGETIFTSDFLDLVTGMGVEGGADLSRSLVVPSSSRNWGYSSTEEMLDLDETKMTGLSFIKSQLMPRSGLSFQDVVDLTNSLWFGGRLAITNKDKTRLFNGQLSEMRLMVLDANATSPFQKAMTPITEDICRELQAFLRLRHRLGWSIPQLDVALSALSQHQVAHTVADSVKETRTITFQLLQNLSHVIALSKQIDMPVASLLPLWSTLDTHGKGSLYERVFLGRATTLSGGDAFRAHPETGKYFENPDPIGNHLPALQAALKRTPDDLECLFRAAGITSPDSTFLNMEKLSQIYRHSLMGSILDVSPRDYLDVRNLIFQAGDIFHGPSSTLKAVEGWRQLTESGWSKADIMASLDPASSATSTATPEIVRGPAGLVEKLSLGHEEFKYFTTPGCMLPINVRTMSLAKLRSLDSYRILRDSIAQETNSLVYLLRWVSNPPANASIASWASELASATIWPEDQLLTILETKYQNLAPAEIFSRFQDFQELISLQSILDTSRRLKGSMDRPLSQHILLLFKVAVPRLSSQTEADFSTTSS